MQIFHTYLINLDERLDRYKNSITLLKDLKVVSNVKRVSAFNTYIDEGLSKVENARINCALSHFLCMQSGWAAKNEFTLVLEDDFERAYDFDNLNTELEILINELPNDWDVLFLGANLYNNGLTPAVSSFSNLLYKMNYGVGMHAVLYSWKGLEILRKHILGIDSLSKWIKINVAVDVWLSKQILPNLKTYIPKKHLFTQRESYSNIEHRFVDYKEELHDKMNQWHLITAKNDI